MVEKAGKRVAVIGAGTMGPGIAMSYARAGASVKVYSRQQKTLDRAQAVMMSSLDLLTEKGKLSPSGKEETVSRVEFTDSLESAAGEADLLVETVVENKDVKRDLLAKLATICPSRTVFASNTSTLNIFEISPRPLTTVITHWFAPPHLIPLVEVVRGPETTEGVMETVVGELRAMGKVPVVLNQFVPGFVINRLLRALGRESFYLLDNGIVTPEALDRAVKASLAPRMMVLGIVQRYDFTGLDLSARNLANPEFTDAPEDHHPKSLFSLVEAGHLGVKTGRGFYDYGGRPLTEILRERDEKLMQVFDSTTFCLDQ